MAHLKRATLLALSVLITTPIFAADNKNAHPAAKPAARASGAGAVHRAPAPVHAFQGHNFHGRVAWDQGKWKHERRNGRDGWWYDVDGAAYYYDKPQYPYPTNISSVEDVEQLPPPEGPSMTCTEAEQVVPQVRAHAEQLWLESKERNSTNGQFDYTKHALNGLLDNFNPKGKCSNERERLRDLLTEQRALYYCPKLDRTNRRAELQPIVDNLQDIVDGTACNLIN